MKKMIVFAVTGLLALALAPLAGAHEGHAIDCGQSDGRERLTPNGFEVSFQKPWATTYELVATADNTKPVRAQRDATFLFTADFAPHEGALVKAQLEWTESGDFDVLIQDEQGADLAAGTQRLVFDSPEVAGAEIEHCQDFRVVARSGPSHPNAQLKLTITVQPAADLLACAENDPAPGCAGKAAGAAPDPVADERTRVYLGGSRPGNVEGITRYVGSQTAQSFPLSSTMTPERPTTGTPNTFVRPLTGNPDFGEGSNFFPYFRLPLPEGTVVKGPIHALAWVSSQTMTPADKLHFDLMVDGGTIQRVDVPGSKLGPHPRPIHVVFDGFEATEAFSYLTFGITSPRGNDDPPNQIGQAEWTLFYDSVQFQSRLTLPFALPAEE